MNNFSLLEYTGENYFVSACLLQASIVFSLVFINCFHPIFILIQLGFLCHMSGRNIICQAGQRAHSLRQEEDRRTGGTWWKSAAGGQRDHRSYFRSSVEGDLDEGERGGTGV